MYKYPQKLTYKMAIYNHPSTINMGFILIIKLPFKNLAMWRHPSIYLIITERNFVATISKLIKRRLFQ